MFCEKKINASRIFKALVFFLTKMFCEKIAPALRQCTMLGTSSTILCTDTVQLNCSSTRGNRSSLSSQAGPESRRAWERTVDRPSFDAVGEALKPSVASIPLFPGFPGVGAPREATPPRGGSVVSAEAKTRLPAISCTSVAL